MWRAAVSAYDRLIDLCAAVTALAVLFLTFGITLDVAVRTLGLGTIDWMLEASEYALLLLTFFGAPWALREGAHVRVDVVVNALPKAVAQALEIIADLLGLGTSLVLLVWGFSTTLGSARLHSMVYKLLVFPEWWLYAPIAFSGALLAIEFVRRLVRALRGEVIAAPPPEMV
jgi:TRAP-type C4-dicarboxylate transport system permease small subunit